MRSEMSSRDSTTEFLLTCREVPVPRVDLSERYLITALDYSGFYRCVVRYG